jgi:hypothetical protein
LVLAAILLGVCVLAVVYIATISCCTMCRREAWESSPWVVLSRKANSTNPANSLEVQAQGTWQSDGRLRVGHCHDQPRNQSGSCINRALTPPPPPPPPPPPVIQAAPGNDVCNQSSLSGNGGNAGYERTISANGGGFTVQVEYQMFTKRDRVIFWREAADRNYAARISPWVPENNACRGAGNWADCAACAATHPGCNTTIPTASAACSASSTCLFDSGCVPATTWAKSPRLSIPLGTTNVKLVVVPNCQNGQSGTAWNVKLRCLNVSSLGTAMGRRQLDGQRRLQTYARCPCVTIPGDPCTLSPDARPDPGRSAASLCCCYVVLVALLIAVIALLLAIWGHLRKLRGRRELAPAAVPPPPITEEHLVQPAPVIEEEINPVAAPSPPEPPDRDMWIIFLIAPDGQRHAVEVMHSEWSIETMHEKVRLAMGIPAADQVLSFGGRTLRPGKKITSYGVQHCSELLVAVRDGAAGVTRQEEKRAHRRKRDVLSGHAQVANAGSRTYI